MVRYAIELDCAPGNPRPGDLLPVVLADTGLDEKDFDNTSRQFGNWEWALKAGKTATYKKARATIERRITQLYHKGLIRYGSW